MLLLILSAFVVFGTASRIGNLPWDVHFACDGSVTISPLQERTPTAVVRSSECGRFVSSLRCCEADLPNRVCKKSSGFITQIDSTEQCYTYDSYSNKPVDKSAYINATLNLTGHIYGGPEQYRQYWPLDDVQFEDYSYVTKMEDNQGIADPYWLSSDGYFIYVHPETSLFIDQNIEYDHYIKLTSRNKDPYPSPAVVRLRYTVCKFQNAREAHLYAVQNYLGKPTGIPDERMITHPIWSTWARYKADITEKAVQKFANQVIQYDYNNSQLEIDDNWETCYGSLTFNTKKFPNIKNLTDNLKKQGFRVTLWIHPFVNIDCNPYHKEGVAREYFVNDVNGSTVSTWWNGVASVIDFTNPEAIEWWIGRLKAMQEENGIDSFKFDGGETSWMPQIPVLSGDLQLQPNIFSERYVQTVAQFGDMVEVRVGHQTQDQPVFVRMLDKDSRWDFENGLPTLITTLLEMNLVGYTHVLPDMVGGNGYNGAPTKELFIRWLQANVFMPSIQYSYVPWDFDFETVDICKKFTKLHADYAPKIIAALKKSVEDGTPANAPIWWVDPTDKVAQEISDEFLLGEDLLVAPVIVEGAKSRDIYLPAGYWQDQANPANGITQGPFWLRDYPAPLDTLPYFTLQPAADSERRKRRHCS